MVQRRAKLKTAAPVIPMEIRVEKAVEAIYVCCFDKEVIEDEDERLLNMMLSAVFPTIKHLEIQRIVKDKARRVAEGNDDVVEPKPLSKEAIQLQMKDLQFLKQNTDT